MDGVLQRPEPIRRFAAPPPAPSRRGGQCMMNSPGGRVRGGNKILTKGFTNTVVVSPWHRIDRLSPPWGGGWNIPLPCRSHLWLNGFRGAPPPPGRSAASSRPLHRGRAV